MKKKFQERKTNSKNDTNIPKKREDIVKDEGKTWKNSRPEAIENEII
jgi:hypothetical protein